MASASSVQTVTRILISSVSRLLSRSQGTACSVLVVHVVRGRQCTPHGGRSSAPKQFAVVHAPCGISIGRVEGYSFALTARNGTVVSGAYRDAPDSRRPIA